MRDMNPARLRKAPPTTEVVVGRGVLARRPLRCPNAPAPWDAGEEAEVDEDSPPSDASKEGEPAATIEAPRPLTWRKKWATIEGEMVTATAAFDKAMNALRRTHQRLREFEEEEDDPEVSRMLRESLLPVRARAQAAGLDAAVDAAAKRRHQLLEQRRREEEERPAVEERRLKRRREQEELRERMRRDKTGLHRLQAMTQRRLAALDKEELFEELAATKAANIKRAWEEHPERFCCYGGRISVRDGTSTTNSSKMARGGAGPPKIFVG